VRATLLVDCARWQGPLRRIWSSIGYDEINWTYTGRGKALYRTLRDVAEVPYHVRNHNALTSGNGLSEPARGSTNVYQERPDGTPVYDFTLLDRLYDTITAAGFHPIVELGFLPRDLVPVEAGPSHWLRDVGREVYETEGLWKLPPRDFGRWQELVYRVVRHAVDRHGATEVERWYFEVWNEPNLPNYWRGTLEDYCRLYDHAVAGATRAFPSVRIGGPATTGPGEASARDYLARFLAHCVSGRNAVTGEVGTRLDFVSFHTKGAHYSRRRIYSWQQPVERESPSSASMLRDIEAGLEAVAAFPPLRDRPVLVDECDPAVGTIYGVHDNPNFVVTNTEYYPTFLASLIRRVLDLDALRGNRIALVTTWAFYMEGKRFFEGNRTLVTNDNIELPILNGLRMLARLGETRLAVEASHRRDVLDPGASDREVDALAAIAGHRVTVLAWHQADPWWAEGRADVTLTVSSLPFVGPARVRHWRIDGAHSNAYAEWVRLGCPEDPSPAQVARLRARQGLELLEPPEIVDARPGGTLGLTLSLPLHATSLLEIEPARPAARRRPRSRRRA
jgi:xylan 1,4-beta-xylosidase